jgi:hypothetical protein
LPLLITFVLATNGCFRPAGDGPIVVVTAFYPGADAEMVAETVAAPIEQQIKGVERMVRLESESRGDGRYIARARFKPDFRPEFAKMLIHNRVAAAELVLPEAVQRAGVAVQLGAAEDDDKKRVTIAIVDREDVGWQALRRLSEAVLKRLTADGAIVKPAAFPDLDQEPVRVVYRVNMMSAVRLSGLPRQGMTTKSAASRCMDLADAEQKRQDNVGGFEVVNLTAR